MLFSSTSVLTEQDRLQELLFDPDFTGFERKYFPVNFVCMTQYDESMPNVTVAYPPETLEMTFGEYISKKGLTQLRIAETQKYAHVTFFFKAVKKSNLKVRKEYLSSHLTLQLSI